MSDISKYDVLRSDRSISSNGLEARTPFLDRKWAEFYLSINSDTRFHKINNQCEKYLIEKLFQDFQPNILPESVLWRQRRLVMVLVQWNVLGFKLFKKILNILLKVMIV